LTLLFPIEGVLFDMPSIGAFCRRSVPKSMDHVGNSAFTRAMVIHCAAFLLSLLLVFLPSGLPAHVQSRTFDGRGLLHGNEGLKNQMKMIEKQFFLSNHRFNLAKKINIIRGPRKEECVGGGCAIWGRGDLATTLINTSALCPAQFHWPALSSGNNAMNMQQFGGMGGMGAGGMPGQQSGMSMSAMPGQSSMGMGGASLGSASMGMQQQAPQFGGMGGMAQPGQSMAMAGGMPGQSSMGMGGTSMGMQQQTPQFGMGGMAQPGQSMGMAGGMPGQSMPSMPGQSSMGMGGTSMGMQQQTPQFGMGGMQQSGQQAMGGMGGMGGMNGMQQSGQQAMGGMGMAGGGQSQGQSDQIVQQLRMSAGSMDIKVSQIR
jgi:hypothetical protein